MVRSIRMQRRTHSIYTMIQSLLGSTQCEGCRAPNPFPRRSSPWCPVCEVTFTPWPEMSCRTCGAVLPSGFSVQCGSCAAQPPPLHEFQAAWVYGGALQSSILRWKAPGSYGAGTDSLALAAQNSNCPPSAEFDAWIPIPGSPALQRKRHFCPTTDLAHALREIAAKPVAILPALREVSRNASGLRRYRVLLEHLPRRVLLVDDVSTTGRTARTAAMALRQAGVQSVSFWCLARTPRPHEHCPHQSAAIFPH